MCYLFSILKYFTVKGTCDTTASIIIITFIIIINFIVIKFEYCCCKKAFILRWLGLQDLGVTANKAVVVVLLSERAWCFRTGSFSLGMYSSVAGAPRWRTAQHLPGDVLRQKVPDPKTWILQCESHQNEAHCLTTSVCRNKEICKTAEGPT